MNLSSYLKRQPRGAAASLARKMDVSPQVVCDWLKGRRRPRIDNAYLLEIATEGEVPWDQWYPVCRRPLRMRNK